MIFCEIYLSLTERENLVSGTYIFSKIQNAMSKNKHPNGLLGERSNPPALFYCLKSNAIDYRSLKTSQQPPEGYLPQWTEP